jgi:hypothetical protein
MDTKPAIYTTEFWSTIALQLFGILKIAGVFDVSVPNKYVVIGMAALGGFYNAGRGLAKQAQPYSLPAVVNPVTGKQKRRQRRRS